MADRPVDHGGCGWSVALTAAAVVGGLALLAYAADQFVLGAARVALIARIPALLVGMIVIGFGTSAPEMLVSALAAARDEPEIAIGNVIGSNVANLSLLLGLGAVITPLAVDSRTVKREAPLTVGAVLVLALAVQRGGPSRMAGMAMVALMVGVVVFVSVRSVDDPLSVEVDDLARPSEHRLSTEAVRTVLGLIGTVLGAQMLLWGAVDLADRADLGEGFVGATLVAVGTSLPELVTVVQSARRFETDLIVGNLLGSNLFNSLAVGGTIGIIGSTDLDAPRLTSAGAASAVLVTTIAWVAMRTGRVLSRREGAALIAGYVVFVPLMS